MSTLDACETTLAEGNLPKGIWSCWYRKGTFVNRNHADAQASGRVCQSSLSLRTPAATAFPADYTGSRSCSSSADIRPAYTGVTLSARLSCPIDVAICNKSVETRSKINIPYVMRSAVQSELSHLRQTKSCLGGHWDKHKLEQLKRAAVRSTED